jgi:chitodextrinase
VLYASTPTPSYNDLGATVNTPYSYEVQAVDLAGNTSAHSASISAQSADRTPPAAPASVTVTGTTQTSVSLSWAAATDNVGVTGYTVLRGGTAVGTTNGATTFTDTALVPGTTYSYTVTASDAAGNVSPESPPASATTTARLVASK